MTILFVDDQPQILKIYSEEVDYAHPWATVLTAEGGEEALQLLKTHKVDLVFTDARMPRMDGHEFAKRARDLYPEIPVFMITGYAGEITEEDIVANGVRRVFSKPIDLDFLVEFVAEQRSKLLGA
ncbi:MAG: hypothetical protein CL675_13580 [Bdellovibrionaceae bacterium]|nr:hypothetical protein [Pseudobdellovibrionaceae bacterium]